MLNKGRLTTAAVTVAIAVGAGHVMQYGLGGGGFRAEDDAQPAPRPSRPARTSNTRSVETPLYSPLLPRATPTPAIPEEANMSPTLPTTVASIAIPLDSVSKVASGGLGCRADAQATVLPGAIVRVDVRACAAGAPVDITYAGLTLTEQADSTGQLRLDVPALSASADMTFEIEGHDPISLTAFVPDAVWSERVAVVWDGTAPVSVRATDEDAVRDAQTLGDADLQDHVAEVYTISASHGAVALSVVAEATAASCGREVPMRILRSSADNGPQDATISVAFPPCDTLGEFVVLKNLSEDLTVAHN